jgi:hypothetical protein
MVWRSLGALTAHASPVSRVTGDVHSAGVLASEHVCLSPLLPRLLSGAVLAGLGRVTGVRLTREPPRGRREAGWGCV